MADDTTPEHFIQLPTQLVIDLADSPLAIAVYGLIARRFGITGEAIPLSANDLLLLDPSLSYGAAVRALQRLITANWVAKLTHSAGKKSGYTPTWGQINGCPQPWVRGAQRNGRPAHIKAMRLDVRLFDLYLGKIAPSWVNSAVVVRYFTQPLLRLADIGEYALALIGQRRTNQRLTQQSLLTPDGMALCLMKTEQIVAYASQAVLVSAEGGELSVEGIALIGFQPKSAEDGRHGQPLFFVPPKPIGYQIGGQIANQIGGQIANQIGESAIPSSEVRRLRTGQTIDSGAAKAMPCSESIQIQESRSIPQPEVALSLGTAHSVEAPNATVSLLQAAGVSAACCHELATLPEAWVNRAIAIAQQRSDLRNRPGYIVSLLREAYQRGVAPAGDDSALGNAGGPTNWRAIAERLRAEGVGVDLDMATPMAQPSEPPIDTASAAPATVSAAGAAEILDEVIEHYCTPTVARRLRAAISAGEVRVGSAALELAVPRAEREWVEREAAIPLRVWRERLGLGPTTSFRLLACHPRPTPRGQGYDGARC